MLYSIVQKGVFQDSVSLMLLSKSLGEVEGVSQISIMMGTDANKDIFTNTNLLTDEISKAEPSDMCIAIDAENEELIPNILERVKSFLSDQSVKRKSNSFPQFRTIRSALNYMPDANLALISIAGQFATREAKRLLDAGVNVFIFSDNVSIQDEKLLKETAHKKGLIVMGPDCGTGTIKGVPLAFSNVNDIGSIGLIGASGTGLQAVFSGIDMLGEGVSHAIGLGGRDLSEEIGGISALDAIDMLEMDNETDVIVFISKPPAKSVRDIVVNRLKNQVKPVVAIFLGEEDFVNERDSNITYANSLIDTAKKSVSILRQSRLAYLKNKLISTQCSIQGLFCGGTLASEAAVILSKYLGVPFNKGSGKGVVFSEKGHDIIDLGDDVYTVGRAHPMIDPTVRNELIVEKVKNPEVAVIILDIVIGYGSHPEPAEQAVEAVKLARMARDKSLGEVIFMAAIFGTRNDYQNFDNQLKVLKNAGILILPDNSSLVNAAYDLLFSKTKFINSKPLSKSTGLLQEDLKIINIGLASFAENLFEQGVPVAQVNWQPPANGDAKLIKALEKLS